jgi:hypothetical protein
LVIKELLSVHASHMQCEETGSKVIQGHEHCGDHIWGHSQSSLREADGNPNSSFEANAVPL